MTRLISNCYGKHRVRVLKVLKESSLHHEVCELDVDVLLTGDLSGSYLSDDNSSIVPTDTVKNTIQVLAHDHLSGCRLQFAKVIGAHFLENYPHLNQVDIDLRERSWQRLSPHGEPHGHAFAAQGNGEFFTRAACHRDQADVSIGGIRDLLLLKTTGSGFAGFHHCDLTTLPETDDRILSSRVTAEWTFQENIGDGREVDTRAREVIQQVFAENYSPSVQRTLYEMGEALLGEISSIAEVSLTMPNVHFLGLDLGPLGRPGQTTTFLPTDEPHGQIIARVGRS